MKKRKKRKSPTNST